MVGAHERPWEVLGAWCSLEVLESWVLCWGGIGRPRSSGSRKSSHTTQLKHERGVYRLGQIGVAKLVSAQVQRVERAMSHVMRLL